MSVYSFFKRISVPLSSFLLLSFNFETFWFFASSEEVRRSNFLLPSSLKSGKPAEPLTIIPVIEQSTLSVVESTGNRWRENEKQGAFSDKNGKIQNLRKSQISVLEI